MYINKWKFVSYKIKIFEIENLSQYLPRHIVSEAADGEHPLVYLLEIVLFLGIEEP